MSNKCHVGCSRKTKQQLYINIIERTISGTKKLAGRTCYEGGWSEIGVLICFKIQFTFNIHGPSNFIWGKSFKILGLLMVIYGRCVDYEWKRCSSVIYTVVLRIQPLKFVSTQRSKILHRTSFLRETKIPDMSITQNSFKTFSQTADLIFKKTWKRSMLLWTNYSNCWRWLN